MAGDIRSQRNNSEKNNGCIRRSPGQNIDRGQGAFGAEMSLRQYST